MKDNMEVDEMDQFIASEDDDNTEKQIKPKVKKLKLSEAPSQMDMGISEDAWRDIQDIFGDGTDYDWALQLQAEVKYNSETQDSAVFRLEHVYEPSVIKVNIISNIINTN